jgi:glycerate kinase
MKIIVAADSFKGSLSAKAACGIIAGVLAERLPNAEIVIKPMADGGEGTAETVRAACNGIWISHKVMGPLPQMQVQAPFVWLEKERIALIEMACASGITLLTPEQLNPLKTTTCGTGQLMQKALEKGAGKIFLAIGGSATMDMGIGAAMALGWRFLDAEGKPTGLGGEELEKIERIVPPQHPFPCPVTVLSDVNNPLCGPNGAAEVFGPQKGAAPQVVKRQDAAMKRLSGLVKQQLGIEIADLPGAGAAGGLGAGAAAFMNAEIVSGIEAVMDMTGLKKELSNADWIITGEGKFDHQSLRGKVVWGILRAAQKTKARVAVLAGKVELEKSEYMPLGIAAAIGLKKEDMTLEYAMQNSEKLLKRISREFAQKYLQ